MQVYLPEELYDQLKRRGLRASELLQAAIRVELRRQELSAEADRYLEALAAEVGEPTPREASRAETMVRRLRRTRARKTG